MSPRLERALRSSAVWHAGQTRKGSDVPYFVHAAAVALILDRAGFEEDVVIAGLLHDVVEDTGATFDDVAAGFGPAVVLSATCSLSAGVAFAVPSAFATGGGATCVAASWKKIRRHSLS